MIPWLDSGDPFPPPEQALRQPNGLLAAGGDLSPRTLIAAYRRGIFPWYSPDSPRLWWSPDPRMVLFPSEFRPSRSLRRRLRRGDFSFSSDLAFAEVIAACAATPRPGQDGTWIVDEIVEAYRALHELGHAHSVECWQEAADGRPTLVGGLYGVCLGRMFYGESMFSRVSDASKAALAALVRQLHQHGVEMIDCQMNTAHLASLGAREIARAAFQARLAELTARAPFAWPAGEWRIAGRGEG